MGVLAALPDLDAGGCSAARALPAGGAQRPALRRQDGLPMALPAARIPALDGGLPTSTPLDAGRRLRECGPRPAGDPAAGPGTRAAALGRHPRRPDLATDARERRPRRLRRLQEE